MTHLKIITFLALAAVITLAGCKEDLFEEEIVDCPMIESTDPSNQATGVPISQIITVEFDKPMDPTTANSTSIFVEGVAGTVSYSGNTASFTPSSPLEFNTTYTGRVTTDVKDAYGLGIKEDYTWSFTTEEFSPFVNLRSVKRFGIIAGTGISNNAGPSEINNMDIGIYPGFRSSITGFAEIDGGSGIINNGDFYAADDSAPIPSMLLQAKDDLTEAYLAAKEADFSAPVTLSGDLGGRTLTPGIYRSISSLSIQNGDLTLDGQGDPNAEWIFQIFSGLTTVGSAPFPSSAGGNVNLIGGAQAKNITWQVGSSATIGDYTSFNGNILALNSITMNPFARTNGRMLASDGSVTLTSTNTINKP